MTDRSARRVGALLALPAASFVFFLLVIPLLLLVRVSLYEGGGQSGFGIGGGGAYYQPGTWSVSAYRQLFAERYILELLQFNALFGLGVATLCICIGFGLALFIAQLAPRWRPIAWCCVVLPKFANVLIVIYGLKLILSGAGPVREALRAIGAPAETQLNSSLFGAAVGTAYFIVPYVAIVMASTLSRIDPMLVHAAHGLGASGWATFRHVLLPLCSGGLRVSIFIAMIWSIGAFAAPQMLGTPDEITLGIEVHRQMFENINWPRGAATAVLLILVYSAAALVATAACQWLERGGGR
jgi:ABC-type spermidine/putrescine transport system permease subunit I